LKIIDKDIQEEELKWWVNKICQKIIISVGNNVFSIVKKKYRSDKEISFSDMKKELEEYFKFFWDFCAATSISYQNKDWETKTIWNLNNVYLELCEEFVDESPSIFQKYYEKNITEFSKKDFTEKTLKTLQHRLIKNIQYTLKTKKNIDIIGYQESEAKNGNISIRDKNFIWKMMDAFDRLVNFRFIKNTNPFISSNIFYDEKENKLVLIDLIDWKDKEYNLIYKILRETPMIIGILFQIVRIQFIISTKRITTEKKVKNMSIYEVLTRIR